MRLQIGTRLGLGYGAVIVALLVVLILSVGAFEVSRRIAANIRQVHIPSIEASNTMVNALEQMENEEARYFLPVKELKQHLQAFDSHAADFKQAHSIAELHAFTPDEHAAITLVSQHFGAYLHVAERIRGLLAAGERDAARRLNLTESMTVAEQVRSAVNDYRDLNLQEILQKQAEEEQILQIAEWVAAGIALLGIILATLIWRRNMRAIVSPLRSLEAATASIASGRFVQAAHPQADRTTEIAALQQDFNAMAQQLETMTRGLEEKVATRTQELQTAKDQLERMVQELRSLDKLKSDLMSVVSHELLTPINFVMAYGSSLEEEVFGTLTPDQRLAARRIVEGSQRLTRMVRNVLDYTQLESGRLSIRPENLDYASIIREVAESLQGAAAAKSQTLEIAVPADLPPVWGDPARVGQILQELLDNAIKFTSEQGRLRIAVSHDADVVTTEVSDTGIGMSDELRTSLFKGFTQGDTTSTRAYGGLGLGLAIVHHLITRMGGTITVDSSLGRGSTFRFTLPRANQMPL